MIEFLRCFTAWLRLAALALGINAGAALVFPRTFMVLGGAKESKLKRAIAEIGYSQYLERYRLIAQTISEVDSISTGPQLTLKVRHYKRNPKCIKGDYDPSPGISVQHET